MPSRPRKSGAAPVLPGPSALDHVVELTRSRDRALVEASLISALVDLLGAREVTLWRLSPEGPDGRPSWRRLAQRRSEQADGDGTDTGTDTDTGSASDDALPEDQLPEHLQCLREDRMRTLGADAAGRSRVLMPMGGELEGGGVIELALDRPLDPRDGRVATSMLRIHANFMHLLDYSERDTLTGLLNRKSFDETFMKATVLEARRQFADDGEDRRSGRIRHQYLGVIDVDHFKRVNDVHGHLIGDEVLVLVARIMRGALRSEDRLYRFGGEEFVVLLDASDAAGARTAFERLRLAVAAYDFPRAGHVTVSVGYVDVRPGDTPQSAFSRADQGVYHAKANGRDQVVAHADLVASGVVTESDGENDIELF
jgi:diguanylate cyclase (GGDEF)-like protein